MSFSEQTILLETFQPDLFAGHLKKRDWFFVLRSIFCKSILTAIKYSSVFFFLINESTINFSNILLQIMSYEVA